MTRSKLSRYFTPFAIGTLAACSGALVVDDKPQSRDSATADDAAHADVSTSEVWTGKATHCPSDVPSYGDPCAAGEGQICAYRSADPDQTGIEDYRECGCWLAQSGGTEWDCYQQVSGPPCPESQPEPGASCDGTRGEECDYPVFTRCSCESLPNEGIPTWACGQQERVNDTSRPDGIDPATPVDELDDAQRQAWCGWALVELIGDGFPEPIDQIDADGYVTQTTCGYCARPDCNGSIPIVSTADCAANLALSSCEAPVESLTDCVRSIASGGWPEPRGCAPYLDSAGCSGTMVTAGPPLDGAAAGPVNFDFGGVGYGATSACSVKVR